MSNNNPLLRSLNGLSLAMITSLVCAASASAAPKVTTRVQSKTTMEFGTELKEGSIVDSGYGSFSSWNYACYAGGVSDGKVDTKETKTGSITRVTRNNDYGELDCTIRVMMDEDSIVKTVEGVEKVRNGHTDHSSSSAGTWVPDEGYQYTVRHQYTMTTDGGTEPIGQYDPGYRPESSSPSEDYVYLTNYHYVSDDKNKAISVYGWRTRGTVGEREEENTDTADRKSSTMRYSFSATKYATDEE